MTLHEKNNVVKALQLLLHFSSRMSGHVYKDKIESLGLPVIFSHTYDNLLIPSNKSDQRFMRGQRRDISVTNLVHFHATTEESINHGIPQIQTHFSCLASESLIADDTIRNILSQTVGLQSKNSWPIHRVSSKACPHCTTPTVHFLRCFSFLSFNNLLN